MCAYWGDGDGMNALSSYMFQLGSNYEEAVSRYQQYFCRDISDLSINDFHINVIPFSKRAQVSRILWKLKKLKFEFAVSANTLCGGSAQIDADSYELEYNYYASGSTTERDPDLDTDYNRHIYFIPGDSNGADDESESCDSPSEDPPDGTDYRGHQVRVSAQIGINNPTIGFKYYFNGDVDDPSNCIGFGIENLADGLISIGEDGPRDYQGYSRSYTMKRTDYFNLGSIVPKTAEASFDIPGKSWGGVTNDQASLQSVYNVSIGGVQFGVTVGRNATSVSNQSGIVVNTDVNPGVIGDYNIFTLTGSTFK